MCWCSAVGLQALEAAGLRPLAAQQGLRRIEVQFLLPRDQMDDAVKALHDALVTDAKANAAASARPRVARNFALPEPA